MKNTLIALAALLLLSSVAAHPVLAQEVLPYEATDSDYHPAPRYRESESHPFRIIAYVLHPIGWVLREAIFRPLSYFAGSSPTTRDVMGFREPYDYRRPECFSGSDSTPNCHEIMPFNYNKKAPLPSIAADEQVATKMNFTDKEVFFPNVNFDFNKRSLNELGKGQVKQLSDLLTKSDSTVKIVLQGNTDDVGSDAYNQRLGMDRARAVKNELAKLGIPADRMETVSFGESTPVSLEKTDEGRALNRRVETKLQP